MFLQKEKKKQKCLRLTKSGSCQIDRQTINKSKKKKNIVSDVYAIRYRVIMYVCMYLVCMFCFSIFDDNK